MFLENNVLSKANYESFDGNNYFMMTDYASIMKMRELFEFNLLLDLGHLHVSAQTLGLNYAKECCNLSQYTKWCHISHNNGIEDQHSALIQDCDEVLAYKNWGYCRVPTTLEVVGSVKEVVSSRNIIE